MWYVSSVSSITKYDYNYTTMTKYINNFHYLGFIISYLYHLRCFIYIFIYSLQDSLKYQNNCAVFFYNNTILFVAITF